MLTPNETEVQAPTMHNTLPWYVYMLLCDSKTFYIGITDNITNRISQHKNKENISTKKFSDLKFVYAEKYESKYDAAKRERQLKGWSHKKKQMLVDGKLGYKVCTEIVEEILQKNLNH